MNWMQERIKELEEALDKAAKIVAQISHEKKLVDEENRKLRDEIISLTKDEEEE